MCNIGCLVDGVGLLSLNLMKCIVVSGIKEIIRNDKSYEKKDYQCVDSYTGAIFDFISFGCFDY